MVKTDKLDETFTMRIPSCLKNFLDNMSETQKHAMHVEIRELMAKSVHMSKFDASIYLSSENATDTK